MTNSQILARILRSAKRDFDCLIIDSKITVKAAALASLIKDFDEHIVVGDVVFLEKQKDEYVIVAIAPRKNEIFRLISRERKKKILASNCDVIVIVSSVSKPAFKLGLIDRYLVRAQQWNIPAIIVHNKMDQFDHQFDIPFIQNRFKNLVVKQYEICAKDEFYQLKHFAAGLADLKQDLKNKTAIFLGQSGVGKSQLISVLCGQEVELKSAEIGKVGKGKHTTTWAELVLFDFFSFIDSPGVRSFSLDDLLEEDLISYFPDLAAVAIHCQFSNCDHHEKVKGCAFWKNPDPLLLSRLDSFKKIMSEVEEIPDWEKRK
jgi:ribosome biogenesis GTPase